MRAAFVEGWGQNICSSVGGAPREVELARTHTPAIDVVAPAARGFARQGGWGLRVGKDKDLSASGLGNFKKATGHITSAV